MGSGRIACARIDRPARLWRGRRVASEPDPVDGGLAEARQRSVKAFRACTTRRVRVPSRHHINRACISGRSLKNTALIELITLIISQMLETCPESSTICEG